MIENCFVEHNVDFCLRSEAPPPRTISKLTSSLRRRLSAGRTLSFFPHWILNISGIGLNNE